MTLSEQFRALGRLSVEGEDEAWHMSRRPLARGTTAFVSETLRDAPDLGEAMRRIARAYNVIHGGGFNRVEQRPDRLVYRIADDGFPFDPALSAEAARAMMETVLVFVHAMLSLVAGEDLGPQVRCVRVRRRRPARAEGPLDFWAAPVRFGASDYRIEYAPAVAALSVRPDFASFGSMDVCAKAIELIDARARDDGAALVDRVRTTIADGACDQLQVARRLGLSVATLRRRLAVSGHGFRELRAEVLNGAACRLLRQRRDPGEIAETLGFADGRSFARAFKSWNGVTPVDYRTRASAAG